MEVSQEFGDRVTFVGIPGLSNVDSMKSFVADTGTDGIVHLPDPEGDLWERFDVRAHRTYILVNDDGTLVTAEYGDLRGDVVDLIER